MDTKTIKEDVKARYAKEALKVSTGCRGASRVRTRRYDDAVEKLYDDSERKAVPEAAVLASLGCGNPTALAQLRPGQVVLDLGSGGGIDVLLSAQRVGPAGKAYGLDMTDEMLALANANKRAAGATNVEFLKGEIEDVPLPANTVDVIISNCVINLSADKNRVLSEAFRVLKPGGRLAVSDIVTRGEVPDAIRRQSELWVRCAAGALEETDYRARLAAAGFEDVEVEPTRIFSTKEVKDFLDDQGLDSRLATAEIDGKFMSAFIRATKPLAG